jgi:iron(III) transport system ATP-binding protein
MALAERIVLLNGGFVEQAGTPTELYAHPRSLFAAEFMGMNNRVEGVVDSVADGHARLQVEGVVLEGEARGDALTPGGSGVGVIRLERSRLADAPGPNRVLMRLETAMYLGERFELLLRRGKWTVRAFADRAPNVQEHLVELPADALWIY